MLLRSSQLFLFTSLLTFLAGHPAWGAGNSLGRTRVVAGMDFKSLILFANQLCVINMFTKATSVPFRFTSMPSVPLVKELSWAEPMDLPFMVKLQFGPF